MVGCYLNTIKQYIYCICYKTIKLTTKLASYTSFIHAMAHFKSGQPVLKQVKNFKPGYNIYTYTQNTKPSQSPSMGIGTEEGYSN